MGVDKVLKGWGLPHPPSILYHHAPFYALQEYICNVVINASPFRTVTVAYEGYDKTIYYCRCRKHESNGF